MAEIISEPGGVNRKGRLKKMSPRYWKQFANQRTIKKRNRRRTRRRLKDGLLKVRIKHKSPGHPTERKRAREQGGAVCEKQANGWGGLTNCFTTSSYNFRVLEDSQ